MTIKQAKELDMVDYLSKLGHEPASIRGHDYWYKSPLGSEKTPSFKVNRTLNRWYDFREGRGGNLVDFGVAYHRCTVSELLQQLSAGKISVAIHDLLGHPASDNNKSSHKNNIEIISTNPVTSFMLLRYLKDRRIPPEIAYKYLTEVRYRIGDKTYYALGFKNDSGGYELRNEKFKGSSSPKDSTFIDNGVKEIAVFEGIFDFLSYRTMHNKQQAPEYNFLILNSTSFFEKNLPKMQQYEKVHLYLDNDKTGQSCTQKALALDSQRFKDQSTLYQHHNDLNDWLISLGKTQNQQHRQKP